MSADVAVIIPAAGAGRRLGGVHKPFLELAGRPILLHALKPFLHEARVGWIVIALPAAVITDPPDWLTALDPRITLVRGGEERMHSVRLALQAVPEAAAIVLVHDAARPLVSAALIRRAIDAAAGGRCVVAAVPATDTIQRVDSAGRITETPDRSQLWLAQTPQAFPRGRLLAAAANAARTGFSATDDAALVIHDGGTVHVIEGERENLKVTVPADLIAAEALLQYRSGPAVIPFRDAGQRRRAGPAIAAHLGVGGCIAYPTETVYGFGCLLQPEPLHALSTLKRRDAARPFLVLIPDARTPGLAWHPVARALADAFWPGPLTLALPADPSIFPDEVRAADGTVAVRWSPAPAVADILRAVGAPITSTSANAPGAAPARDAAAAAAAVGALGANDRFHVLDGGALPPSPPSTLVRVFDGEAEILREGAVATADILRVLGSHHVE